MPYKNKEKRQEYAKKYYQENKKRILKCSKEYYQENKKRISKRHKGYNYNFCKCGNKKYIGSKQCRKCHHNKHLKKKQNA